MEANGTSRHHRLQRLAGDRHRCHRIGYGIHEAAKAHGAKCQPGGVGEVIKPKTWVSSTIPRTKSMLAENSRTYVTVQPATSVDDSITKYFLLHLQN